MEFLETVETVFEKIGNILASIWANSFVKALVFLIVAFVAAGLASFLAKKLCRLLKLDAKLDKWGVNEGQVGTSIKFIGKLVYLIVFLLFLPAALNALGLEGVSEPITGFVSACVGALPNILFALILIFVGIFLGQILAQIVTVLLAKTKVDTLTQKITNGKETGIKISLIVGKVVYAVVLLIAIVQALTILGIEAVSAPAMSIINAVFGAIPNIILAAVVVAVGLLVANIVCNLLGNLLTGVDLNGLVAKILPNANIKFSMTKLVVNVVRVVIMLFIVAQGIEVLGLGILTNIFAAVIAYLPLLIKAIIIAIAAFFGANLLETFVVKSTSNAKIGKITKAMVFVVAGFMILSQLDFATFIVNSAFIIIMLALAVAFAIAFGTGGKDFAKKTLDKVDFDKVKVTEEKKDEE